MALHSALAKFKGRQNSIRRGEYLNISAVAHAKKRFAKEQRRAERYRLGILQNVPTFQGLDSTQLAAAAQCLEEVMVQEGDYIVEQDALGDSFFIVEEGVVKVLKKADPRDPQEEPRELAQLGPNSFFGEIALLTSERRSASVVCASAEAKLLKMTKLMFDEFMSTCNELHNETRLKLGRDIVNKVPLFQRLTSEQKQKMVGAMVPVTFSKNSYITRQGQHGNTFYVITDGQCRVTINCEQGEMLPDVDGSMLRNDAHQIRERELSRLYPGDFFGELALMETSNKRTANVVTMTRVSCMTLSRTQFHKLLNDVKDILMEHSAMRTLVMRRLRQNRYNRATARRRITGLDDSGLPNPLKNRSLFRRLSRFMVDALRSSMYARMYTRMLCVPRSMDDYGELAAAAFVSSPSRSIAARRIGEVARRVLATDPHERSDAEILMVTALLSQQSVMRDKYTKDWPQYRVRELARRVGGELARANHHITDIGEHGTCAYLVLRGCARAYSVKADEETGDRVRRFEEDFFPGDLIGETALDGMHTRFTTVVATTNVDLMVISEADLDAVRGHGMSRISVEDKFKMLHKLTLFRHWEPYKLYQFAYNLEQEEVPKGRIIVDRGSISQKLYFVNRGIVEVVHDAHESHGRGHHGRAQTKEVLSTVKIGGYFGESGALMCAHAIPDTLVEPVAYVASTPVELLWLGEHAYRYLDSAALHQLQEDFQERCRWHDMRFRHLEVERRHQRKRQRAAHREVVSMQEHEAELKAEEVARQGTSNDGRPRHDTTLERVKTHIPQDPMHSRPGNTQDSGAFELSHVQDMLNSTVDVLMVKATVGQAKIRKEQERAERARADQQQAVLHQHIHGAPPTNGNRTHAGGRKAMSRRDRARSFDHHDSLNEFAIEAAVGRDRLAAGGGGIALGLGRPPTAAKEEPPESPSRRPRARSAGRSRPDVGGVMAEKSVDDRFVLGALGVGDVHVKDMSSPTRDSVPVVQMPTSAQAAHLARPNTAEAPRSATTTHSPAATHQRPRSAVPTAPDRPTVPLGPSPYYPHVHVSRAAFSEDPQVLQQQHQQFQPQQQLMMQYPQQQLHRERSRDYVATRREADQSEYMLDRGSQDRRSSERPVSAPQHHMSTTRAQQQQHMEQQQLLQQQNGSQPSLLFPPHGSPGQQYATSPVRIPPGSPSKNGTTAQVLARDTGELEQMMQVRMEPTTMEILFGGGSPGKPNHMQQRQKQQLLKQKREKQQQQQLRRQSGSPQQSARESDFQRHSSSGGSSRREKARHRRKKSKDARRRPSGDPGVRRRGSRLTKHNLEHATNLNIPTDSTTARRSRPLTANAAAVPSYRAAASVSFTSTSLAQVVQAQREAAVSGHRRQKSQHQHHQQSQQQQSQQQLQQAPNMPLPLLGSLCTPHRLHSHQQPQPYA